MIKGEIGGNECRSEESKGGFVCKSSHDQPFFFSPSLNFL